ncbi:MAG: hypothetical protein KDD66_11700 [Bdellovibrionales bacterium]|nr:hypothetical protein [Bdellovibrionales bacterium]
MKRFSRSFGFLTAAWVAASGIFACAHQPPTPQKTQLEIRQLQTREYPNKKSDTKRIMKAVLNVLQDEGFIVTNADRELGFITAKKETDVKDGLETFMAAFAQGSEARYRVNQIMEASVNITEFGSQTRVRAIFQTKVLDNFGGTVSVQQIEDGKFYQEFFAKVDKGVFIEKQGL